MFLRIQALTDPDVPAEGKLQLKDLDPRRTVLQGQGSAGGRTLVRGTQRLFVQALLVAQSLVASSTIYKQQWGKTIAHCWGDPRALCLCPPVSLPIPSDAHSCSTEGYNDAELCDPSTLVS